MASTAAIFQNALLPSIYASRSFQNQNPSQFIASNSILKLKKQALLQSPIRIKQLKTIHRICSRPIVFAAQSNIFKVIQTVWKVGKDGVEAGTSMVPDAVPRPIARISVTFAAVSLALFVLKSFLSTAFFALAVMGLSYFTFLALNKGDDGPKGGGGETTTTATSVDDSLEEARRIMEKYK